MRREREKNFGRARRLRIGVDLMDCFFFFLLERSLTSWIISAAVLLLELIVEWCSGMGKTVFRLFTLEAQGWRKKIIQKQGYPSARLRFLDVWILWDLTRCRLF